MRDENRAARRAAELVLLERGEFGAVLIVRPGIRVQLAVLQKLISGDVQRVGARARGYVDDAAARAAVLGCERIGNDGELFDAVLNRAYTPGR